MKTLRVILGDQLNAEHSWFKETNPNVLYAFFECWEEATYVRHHIQKVVGIFSAMRQFADFLKLRNYKVHYIKLSENPHKSLTESITFVSNLYDVDQIELQYPDELRVYNNLKSLISQNEKIISFVSSEHFITTPQKFKSIFSGKKSFLMETFYRTVRKEFNILMDDDKPLGGTWNLDAQNRKKLPKNHEFGPRYFPSTDVTEVLKEVQSSGILTLGNINNPEQFPWPTNAKQAWAVFDHWLENGFAHFGSFQDAMTTKDWALYHSRISFALNLKLIHPLEVCQKAEAYFRSHADVPLNAAEGFIRQILGWREFMRGVYWNRMPEFGAENFFNHTATLPQWFWTGNTKMACQKHAIEQSLEYGYAHHIQRLMVTGNFLLLAGVHPDEVDLWYLGIYIDAFEWVEITNTRGMSQFADGGWIATKPYVASANYMKKMGDYCDRCAYDPKGKTEENACPLNALYWDFFDRHRELLASNFRLGMVYRTWDKMNADQKEGILDRANFLKSNLDKL